MVVKSKRILAIFVCIVMLVGLMPITSTASSDVTGETRGYSDMPNDWSTVALQHAVDNKLLVGSNGMLTPKGYLSRAEMATFITRAFNASVKGDISSFTDVKNTEWYADYIAKAYQMGVLKGENGLMKPNNSITREEVFVIIARAIKLQPAVKVNKTFLDVNDIADLAKGEVYAMANAGYIQGADGKLSPKGLITRAEFAQVMYNILKHYVDKDYVAASTTDGNVMINTPGVTLKDTTVKGDLIIGDGVGDGEVILDNVTVTGRMVVRGGGENSIIIRGASDISTVIVTRIDGVVSVKVQGDANVEVIYIDDGSDDVNIEGTVGDVQLIASGITVNAISASIGNIDIQGEGSQLLVDSTSIVSSVKVKAADVAITIAGSITGITTTASGTDISGTGSVATVDVQSGATGTSIATPNTNIDVASGVTGVTGGGGAPVAGGTSETNNTTGSDIVRVPVPTGGGYIPPVVSVSAITVTGDAVVGATLTAAPTPGAATGTYQWSICDTVGGAYTNIVGATSSTYTLVAGDATKFVKVTFTATGSYTGTRTSTATAAVLTETTELTTAKTNAKAAADALLTGLTQADYTSASWTALTEAIATDKTAIDGKTTVAEVTGYTLIGTAAKAALVFTGRADLDTAKAAEAALASTDYVDYSAVTTALALPETTNAEVVAKTTAINTAIATLVFANKAAMDTAVAAANAMVEANYSAASWTLFTAARTTALSLPVTTNTEMGARTTALNTAMALLAVDKAALTLAITEEVGADHGTPVYVLTESDYTGATWTAYTGAIAAAIVVETNVAATQTEVNTATTAIGTAKTALVFANKAAMDTAVAAANAMVEANYSAASWTLFTAARTTALALPVTTNTEMGARTTALNTAMALLAVDKAALTLAITAEVGADHGTPVYVLTGADYTGATWTAYTGAITSAIVVEADVAATQAQINTAEGAIGTAKAGLVFTGQANLDAAKAAAAALTPAAYVDYSAVTTALALTETTNSEVVAKTTAINTAIAALVPKSSDAKLLGGTLGGVALSGTFTGAMLIGSSSGSSVTVVAGNLPLVLNKSDENSTIKYVVLQAGTTPSNNEAYTETYVPGNTNINITSSNDRIWLMVTAQDGTTIRYCWIIVTVG